MEFPVAKIGSLEFSPAIYNGAGTVKTLEEVREIAASPAGAITLGSITVEERSGNEGDVLWFGPHNSLNSLGIPNPGKLYYKHNLPTMVRIAHYAGKKLIVNVAGFNVEQFVELAEVAVEGGADAVELNFACPNIWVDGTQKDMISFMPDVMAVSLFRVRMRVGKEAVIIVKVSPYSNPAELKRMAVIIAQCYVNAVVNSNTWPNAFAVNGNRPAITPGRGLAGCAGAGFKVAALGQAIQFREALPDSVQVIGAGGIGSGKDAADYFTWAGVAAVQVVSALLTKHRLDPNVFGRILLEYQELPEPVASQTV